MIARLKAWLRRWLGIGTAPAAPEPRDVRGVSAEAVRRAAAKPAGAERAKALMALFPTPEPPHGIPEATRKELKLAMDAAVQPFFAQAQMSWFQEGIGFLGYPYLAELTQRAEYRVISETRAKEMTRQWIELEYAGDEPDQDLLTDIMEELKKFGVQTVCRNLVEHDGFFGAAHVYIDTGLTDKPEALKTRLVLKPEVIKKGSLNGFRNIEPTWVYPNAYNASDPLRADYFRPTSWWVMGKLVHASRLLTVVSRPMPDLLKAAYAFGGLSLSQMVKPYVDNWLRARQSVSDLLHSFSIIVLSTNMASTLGGDDGAGLFTRIDLFNALRDNRGTFAIDKDTEELANLAVPLGTLDKLQAQAQEQMSGPAQTPLVKLWGVTPSGLNASSDGEIRVFYDLMHALQQAMLLVPLLIMIDVIQLNRWGKIDPNVGFRFVPLWQLDQAGQALVEKTQADIDATYVGAGILDPVEVRKRLAADPHSPYAGLDVEDVPEIDDETPPKGDPATKADNPPSQARSGV